MVEENCPHQGGDSNETEVIQNRLTPTNMKKQCRCFKSTWDNFISLFAASGRQFLYSGKEEKIRSNSYFVSYESHICSNSQL